MLELYLHNFRGFDDAVIPLLRANFLIGENSTGKTSVLAMLRLLTRPDFWLTGSFNTDEHEFGQYRDIVSASAESKREFWVGYVDRDESALGGGFLACFRERDGMPFAYRLAILGESEIGVAVVRPTGIDCLVMARSSEPHGGSELGALRRRMAEARSGYQRMEGIRSGDARTATIGFLSAIMSRFMTQHDAKADLRSFSYPRLAGRCDWIAPIRTKPQRTYGPYLGGYSPEGQHTPYVLNEALSDPAAAHDLRNSLEHFGKASGLFKEVRIRRYGRQFGAPFSVEVVLTRYPHSLSNVGYGVSQALPVVVELIRGKEDSWTIIQQPEVHLHPRAQAALGDLAFDVCRVPGRRLVLETHSDFMVDRFRLRTKTGERHIPAGQVLFFERRRRGNSVQPISIGPDGEYPEDQPDGFRRFFLEESLRILEL